MGKRSDFDKVERDFYPTPYEVVLPLVPFLPKRAFTFAEPCAGDGRLTKHIERATKGVCTFECDIDPQAPNILQKNALNVSLLDLADSEMVITNPPWSRDRKSGFILHRLIEHYTPICPTWFVCDADWVQTKQAAPYLKSLLATVSIGRVKWIEGSKMSGKDNVQWMLFHPEARHISRAPLFFGRNEPPFSGFVASYAPEWTDIKSEAA